MESEMTKKVKAKEARETVLEISIKFFDDGNATVQGITNKKFVDILENGSDTNILEFRDLLRVTSQAKVMFELISSLILSDAMQSIGDLTDDVVNLSSDLYEMDKLALEDIAANLTNLGSSENV